MGDQTAIRLHELFLDGMGDQRVRGEMEAAR